MANDSLYAALTAAFPADRARTVLETPDGATWSYGDLEAVAARYAALLVELGAVPGDRVAVQVEKAPEVLALYLGCLKAGLIYLPLNTAYARDELDYLVRDAEPRVFVCAPERQAEIRGLATAEVLTLDALTERAANRIGFAAPVAAAADDIAAIVYTSGTTGRPKGAMLSHGNLASNGRTLAGLWGFTADDVLLHALPVYHVHGLFVATHCVLLSGAKLLFLPKFDTALVAVLLPRASVMMGVPTFYTRLLAEPAFGREACARMRLFISGSAPLREETFDAFRDRTGHTILERYGMSEAGMITSNPLDGARIGGTVGFALPDVEVRIAGEDGAAVVPGEVGVLEARGPYIFKGYWRQPEKTRAEFTADGFFRSGDLARQDPDGRITIVGRAKDLIITGGLNVYPKEVEQRIDEIAGVLECAVVGLPDDDFGEAVVAVVCRAPDATGLSADDIRAALDGRLARFKLPKRIEFADALPRNAMGKVQKNVLRESLGG